MLLTGRVLSPQGWVADGAVVVRGASIAYAGPRSDLPEGYGRLPAPAGWLAGLSVVPGLVDLHCHGGAGGEFGADEEQSRTAARHHLRHGTTSVVGSLVSARPAQLLAGVQTCARLVADGTLRGIHLEGPFLSEVRRGAQDPDALTDVDPALVSSLVSAAVEAGAPDALVQMTFAPERPGGATLPDELAAYGVLPAVGHTDADDGAALAALRRTLELAPRGGRPLVTHLFNGMRPLHHRDPGPAAAALSQAARGEAVVELVGDGVHLAAGTVRMVFDAVGPHAIALITDAMAASGMPEGRYTLGGREVEVEGRTARLVDGGNIAGGVATLLDVVRWCVEEVGLDLGDALVAASQNPSRTAGFDDIGQLVAGRRADVLALTAQLEPHLVLAGGQPVV